MHHLNSSLADQLIDLLISDKWIEYKIQLIQQLTIYFMYRSMDGQILVQESKLIIYIYIYIYYSRRSTNVRNVSHHY